VGGQGGHFTEEIAMPYKSQAQQRWAHTPAGVKALGGSAKVAEWDAATKGKKLPERKSRRESIAAAIAGVAARRGKARYG
jgi:hypothetical protein